MKEQKSRKINVILYSGFVTIGLYQLIFKQEMGEAAMNLGIALAFDPFSPDVPWKDRKKWQKMALIAQLILVFYCFAAEVFHINDLTVGFSDGFHSQ